MGKRSGGKIDKSKKAGSSNIWLIAGGAAFLIVAVWFTLHMTNKNADEALQTPDNAHVALIATLSPENFTGKAHAAYQAAKEIPEILVEMPCFCGCKDGLGHKSNLYCFADNHGNICDMCQNIALDAQSMHRKGIAVSEIRDKIRAAYGSSRG